MKQSIQNQIIIDIPENFKNKAFKCFVCMALGKFGTTISRQNQGLFLENNIFINEKGNNINLKWILVNKNLCRYIYVVFDFGFNWLKFSNHVILNFKRFVSMENFALMVYFWNFQGYLWWFNFKWIASRASGWYSKFWFSLQRRTPLWSVLSIRLTPH